MAAFYNENDPRKAEWIRQLIRAQQIAPGDVDERSITEVQAQDLKPYTQCHFFAGVAVWSYALRLAGWPDSRPVWTGSCPCPSFSAAGEGRGFDDARHLWPTWWALIRQSRPAVVLGEQVAAAIGHGWWDLVSADLEAEGYAAAAAVLTSAGVGASDIRHRLYFLARLADAQAGGWGMRGGPSRGAGHAEGGDRADRVAHAADPRCDYPGQYGGGLPLHAARPEQFGGAERVADAHGGESGDAGLQRGGQHRFVAPDSGAGGLADSERDGGRPDLALRRAPGGAADAGGGPAGGLGDPGAQGLQGSEFRLARDGDGQREEAHGPAGQPSAAHGGLDDAYGQGLFGERPEPVHGPGAPGNEPGGRGPDVYHPFAHALAGFWRDADWLFCRDGRWRPVRPGSFPLVTGTPARLVRLRGYGDALNAEVARAFIEAVKEAV